MSDIHIYDYQVIFDSSLFILEKEIKEAIREGWQPHGSLATDAGYFYQPMVRTNIFIQKSSKHDHEEIS